MRLTALIVLAVIAAIFVAIGFIRITIGAKYEGSFSAWVKIAGKTIPIYPKSEKPQKETAPKKEKPKKAEKPEKQEKPAEPKPKQSFVELMGGAKELLDFGLEALVDFFDMVYTDILRVRFVSAKKDDPATAAKNYGYAWAVAGMIIPLLENNKNVKKHDVQIDLDYAAEKPTVEGEIRVSVSIGRVLRFAGSKGVKVLVKILKNRKKGGSNYGKAGKQYA